MTFKSLFTVRFGEDGGLDHSSIAARSLVLHTHTHTHTPHIHTYMHTHIHKHIHIHTYIYTHTHIHKHIHSHLFKNSLDNLIILLQVLCSHATL